jgi:hypothetical protein
MTSHEEETNLITRICTWTTKTERETVTAAKKKHTSVGLSTTNPSLDTEPTDVKG